MILTIVLSSAMLCFYFGHLLRDPGNTFFSANGDGIKNYYTAVWHYEYDSSALGFEGMNYPNGEHVMFTDGHFPLVMMLKAWTWMTGQSVNMVFWINMVLLLSFVLSAAFIYKIFREFNTLDIFAALAAVGITFMSPIVNRIGGHYSLSWSFIIPLLIYLFIRWYKYRRISNLIFTSFLVVFASLLHFYYFAIAAGFIGGMWAVIVITEWKRRVFFSALIHGAATIIIPLILLVLITKLGPQSTDRSSIPYGFYYYSCLWEGVFLPDELRHFSLLQNFFRINEWEGTAKIGMVGGIYFLFSFNIFAVIPFIDAVYMRIPAAVLVLGVLVFVFIKKGRRLLWLSNNPLVNAMMWTGFAALLLSFAWPFQLDKTLYTHLGPIKQFRGIGRFAWVFFYIINIAAFYQIARVKWRPILKYAIMISAIILLYRDANTISNGYIQVVGRKKYCEKNLDPVYQLIAQSDSPLTEKYSSIVPIPAFHVGSEVISITVPDHHLANTLIASWKTGLPIASSIMSRTSVNKTVSSIELMMEPYRIPTILNGFDPSKKLLLLHTKGVNPDAGGRVMLQAAELLTQNDSVALYGLSIDQLKIAWQHHIDSLLSIPDDSIAPIIYKPFDDAVNDPGYFTPGSMRFEYIIEPVLVVDDTFAMPLDTSTWYELSMWTSNLLFQGSCYYYIEFAFYNDLDTMTEYRYIPATTLITQVDGDWQRIALIFKPIEPIKHLKMAMLKSPVTGYRLWFDNIMLKPCSVNVVEQHPNYIMVNNRYFPKIK